MMKRLSTLERLILSNRKIAAAERPENLEKTCVKLSGKTGAKGLVYKYCSEADYDSSDMTASARRHDGESQVYNLPIAFINTPLQHSELAD
jgi:hypothetical protein